MTKDDRWLRAVNLIYIYEYHRPQWLPCMPSLWYPIPYQPSCRRVALYSVPSDLKYTIGSWEPFITVIRARLTPKLLRRGMATVDTHCGSKIQLIRFTRICVFFFLVFSLFLSITHTHTHTTLSRCLCLCLFLLLVSFCLLSFHFLIVIPFPVVFTIYCLNRYFITRIVEKASKSPFATFRSSLYILRIVAWSNYPNRN